MHIKLTNGNPEIYTIGQLRKDNPNTSFPKIIPEVTLAEWNVYPCTQEDVPEYDQRTQKVEEGGFTLRGGDWYKVWDIVNKTKEEVAEYDEKLATSARRERDRLLSQSDWVVVFNTEKGTPIPETWVTYRQELRDVTDQPDFPVEIVWPVKP